MIEHDHRLEIQGPALNTETATSPPQNTTQPHHCIIFRFFMIFTIVLEHTALDAAFTSD